MKWMKRLLSLALVLLLALSLLPGAALADGDVITSLNISYDMSQAFPTTRLTGEQVSRCLFAAIQGPKSGSSSSSDDWIVYGQPGGISNWTCLVYRNGDSLNPNNYSSGFTALHGSSELLRADREYYFRFNPCPQARNFDQEALPTVTVNGSPADYVYRNYAELVVYKRVELDESMEWAWEVDVKPDEAVVQKGTTKQFSAHVEGTTQAVTWYVNGGYASSISPSGLLTVGAGETASTLILHAESTANTGAYDEVTVHLISEPVAIDSVEITPASASVRRGGNQDFTVDVTGTDLHDVDWEFIGSAPIGGDSASYISVRDSTTARLYVSANESAETLTVRAASRPDPTKTAEVSITVLPLPQVDSAIAITYDTDAVHFLKASTGAEVTAALTDAITCSRRGAESGSWYVYLNTNGGEIVPSSYVCLCYKNSSGTYVTLENNTDTLDITREYYLRFNIENIEDYEFDPEHIPAVTVSGEAAEDVRWNSHAYTGDLYAYKRIQMEDLFQILAQPEDFAGTIGDTAVFHVSFAGQASFQWQVSTDGGSTWKDSGSAGNKTDTLSVPMTEARLAYRYRCRITGSGGQELFTDVVRMLALASVDDSLNVPGGSLHFSTSPDNPWTGAAADGEACAQSGNAGVHDSDSDLTLSLNVADTSILSFEYYVNAEHSGSNLYDRGELHLDGAEIVDFRVSETVGWQTYALILEPGEHTVLWRYHKDGSTNSGDDCFRLRRVALGGMTATIAIQPLDFTGGVGETFTFHTEAIGTAPSYQWQVSTDGGASWKNSGHTGNATDTLTGQITVARLGHLFRCKITDGGSPLYTNAVRILETPLEIVSQPNSSSCWVGSTFTFSVGVRGSGLSYRWQYHLSGESEWQDCAFSGSDTAELSGTMTQELVNAYFRCIITDRLGNEAVTYNVALYDGGIQINKQPVGIYCEIGDTFAFSVEADGSLLQYQWQVSTNGGETWNNTALSGNKTAAIHGTMKAAYPGYLYRCVLTDCFGGTRTTNPAGLFTAAMLDDALNAPGGSLHFTTATPYPWFPTTVDGQSAAVSSNRGVNDSASDLSLQCSPTRETTLTFEYYVDGEYGGVYLYDRGELYVDDVEVEGFRASFTDGWQSYSLTLAPGAHTIKWRYSKDSGTHSGDDVFMLRNVSLAEPLAITRQPVDYVGPLGSTATFTVEASGSGLSYQWWVKKPSASSFSKSSITGPVYSVELTSARSGNQLYCVVTDAFGNSLQSDTVSMTIGAALAITRQPVDYVGPLGSTATFTVEASGSGLSYQWWVKKPSASSFSKSSITGPVYSVELTSTRSGNQLYCVVTDAFGNSLQSDTVSMTIGAALAITRQPVDYVGPLGSTASFTVEASGSGLSYQWWVKKPSASSFSKSSITGPVYSVELTSARSGNQLYCVVTDAFGNSVQSDTVSMTIGAALAITRQPVDYVGPLGSTASFTVEASGSGLSYQWWVKKPSASSFSKSSITGPVYSVELTSARSGNQLYCVVTDAFGNSVQSDTVSMTIGAALAITQQPVDYVGPLGSTATFTVEASGSGLSYQWWVKKPSASSFSKSSITGPVYSVELTSARSGNQLYCVVTDAFGNSVQSDTVSMTIGAALTITAQPVSYVGPLGSTATFTVEASGSGLTYQWWVKKPSASKFSRSSVTGPTYSVELTEARNGNQLYCVVTDAFGNTVQTNTVSMTASPAITAQPVSYVGPLGSTATFTVEASGSGLSYQWWVKKPSASKFSKSSVTGPTYSVELTEARNGNQLYCVVTDTYGNTAQTNTVSMTVG